MLSEETHWSFVFGVMVVYGISQGLGGGIWKVSSDYYWKDAQKVQPSEAQVYQGITSIPWIVKPVWGLLTDVLPVAGYRRRPYFIFAGILGVISMLVISLHKELHVMLALLALTAGSAGVAIADVTIDACIGFIYSVGSIGSLLGVLLYQNMLKDYPFRSLLFWSQLLSSFSGMLDLILVFRLNLKYAIPDYFFVVIDECVSRMIGRIKWMPLLVLSSKLCPSGVEGTFFAVLMSIDNVGLLTSSWGGGLLLHVLKVTRTEFSNLWIAILIRNILRVFPLALLYLVPESDQHSTILPEDMLIVNEETTNLEEVDETELVSLVGNRQ